MKIALIYDIKYCHTAICPDDGWRWEREIQSIFKVSLFFQDKGYKIIKCPVRYTISHEIIHDDLDGIIDHIKSRSKSDVSRSLFRNYNINLSIANFNNFNI